MDVNLILRVLELSFMGILKVAGIMFGMTILTFWVKISVEDGRSQ